MSRFDIVSTPPKLEESGLHTSHLLVVQIPPAPSPAISAPTGEQGESSLAASQPDLSCSSTTLHNAGVSLSLSGPGEQGETIQETSPPEEHCQISSSPSPVLNSSPTLTLSDTDEPLPQLQEHILGLQVQQIYKL